MKMTTWEHYGNVDDESRARKKVSKEGDRFS